MATPAPTKDDMQGFIQTVQALNIDGAKEYLDRFGASIVDAEDSCRYTPLMIAVIKGGDEQWADQSLEMAKLLLRHGASPVKTMPLGLALIFYVAHDARLLEALLNHQADPEWKSSIGNTALMFAAEQRRIDSVRLLLSRGARADVRNNLGQTALFLAARRNDAAIVRLLLEHGADSEIRDNDGKTALMRAKAYVHDTSDAVAAIERWLDEQEREKERNATSASRHRSLLKQPRISFKPGKG